MNISLVVMAAGMGSRFGGLKQMEPVGPGGEIIAEYSVFDAKRAGFNKVVFIIKREMEEAFRDRIFDKISREMDAQYVFQDIEELPPSFAVPEGRVKPWGTGHAALSCRHVVKEPFAIINADDFYGASAFQNMYGYLTGQNGAYRYAMAGYLLQNTLTENGSVSRGVCDVGEDGYLKEIVEHTHIEKKPQGPVFTTDGVHYASIPGDSVVSMNFWGFTPAVFMELEKLFEDFLKNIGENPLKAEFYLPVAVSEMMSRGTAKVRVLPAHDKWYGFTYKEDHEIVKNAMKDLTKKGFYPEKLWIR